MEGWKAETPDDEGLWQGYLNLTGSRQALQDLWAIFVDADQPLYSNFHTLPSGTFKGTDDQNK